MDTVIGYKGFKKETDGTLRCMNFEYEPGKVYVFDGTPELCKRGFHFCKNLIDVDKHYSFEDNKHVFYKVRASGKIIDGSDMTKSVCSKLELLEEVPQKEVVMCKIDKHMTNVDIVLESNPNVIISGSLALILRGAIPYRAIKDLDFTLPAYASFKNGEVINSFGKSGTECIQICVNDGVKVIDFDLFINPHQIWDEIKYKDKKYKVSRIKNIIEAKFRYFLEGKAKHAEDLSNVLKMMIEGFEDNLQEAEWKTNVNYGQVAPKAMPKEEVNEPLNKVFMPY